MFIAALFITAPNWNRAKCPPVHEFTNRNSPRRLSVPLSNEEGWATGTQTTEVSLRCLLLSEGGQTRRAGRCACRSRGVPEKANCRKNLLNVAGVQGQESVSIPSFSTTDVFRVLPLFCILLERCWCASKQELNLLELHVNVKKVWGNKKEHHVTCIMK